MSDTDLKERLRQMEGQEAAATKARPGLGKLAVILGASALGAGAVYFVTQEVSNQTALPTVQPAEFQAEGSGFGDLARPSTPPVQTVVVKEATPEPAPAPAPVVDGANDSLLAELQQLRADMEAMKTGQGAAESDALKAMQESLDKLKADSEKAAADAEARNAELEAALNARDLEIRSLQADLDMARLSPPGAFATDAQAAPYYDENAELAARREEARAAAEAAAAKEAERIGSPMIAFGGSGGGVADAAGAVADAVGAGGGAAAQEAAKLSDDERFIRDAGRPAPVQRAEIIVNPANTVTQGSIIQAAMETAIDSTLPGPIRAVVTTDVHSYDGSRVLIPRGSKLIGKYSSDVGMGQRRVLVAWERIIMPDAQSVQISAYGADQLGRSGTTGKVDNHLFGRFGSAALISLITAIPAALDDNNGTNSSTTDARTSAAERMGEQATSLMDPYLSQPPTIHIAQGTRITVMVDRDLEIF